MKIVKFSISLVVCCLIFYLLNFPLGMVPPLAKFFSPFSGFWKNNTTLDKIPEVLDFNGLTDKVIVRWDKRHVPHIFANSNYDLYFMQGYLTARDRLWQMEFQTHAAAGRLSEIIGERTLQYDRFHRRIGLQYAAEKSLQLTMENQQSREALEAYSSGVNEYIRNLEQKNFPLEYKILNYKPEKWTPLKCMLLLKSMAWDLTGYASYRELALTKIKDKLSETRMNQLYPVVPPFTEPVIPEGTKWNFDAFGQKKSVNYDFPTTNFSFDDLFVPHEHNGSNNWVVSGELTANGKPILCNDPHLSLSLPSIWYEIQLSSPDVNVYGFSIPGSPSVIIGFNENIAWGLTNAETDVLDYYEIEFNEKSKETYLSNGKSKSAILRIEEIKVRGSETVSDTIYYTHYGPVVYLENEKPYRRSIPTGAALRWTGHYPSNELLAFLRLNQAKDYDDYVEALIHFECPAQNFAFASSGGDIAIWHNGKLPVRKYGQGRFINDGRNSENDWLGFIPHEQLPHAKNPGQEFLCSANQFPVFSDYPFYLCGNYASFTRSTRINDVLKNAKSITAEDMIIFQNDALNLLAKKALPVLFKGIDKGKLDEKETHLLKTMENWNFENRAELIAPTIFEYWWDEFSDLTWDDELDRFEIEKPPPKSSITLDLMISHPESQYFDDKTTDEIEKIGDISLLAFKAAINRLVGKFGDYNDNWEWGKTRGTNINHLMQIPGLGRTGLFTDGNYGIVNATSLRHGPSLRMVVQLGELPRAWGIYPGGQSGNPGSGFYDHMVDDWVAGNIHELIYLTSVDDSHEDLIRETLTRGDN